MSAEAPAAVYRRSGLDTFAACPTRFQAIYEAGVIDTSGPAVRGDAFHRVRIDYIRRLVETQQPSDPQLLQEAMLATLVDGPVPVPIMLEVEDLVQRWGERFELNLSAFLLAEMKLTADEFEWRPDLVYAFDDELAIEDDKTYWSTFDDEAAQRDFQAQFYSWRAAQLWPGFARYRFTFHFVRYGRTATAVFDPADVAAVEPRVRALVGGIQRARETGLWPATPGRHCGYCGLRCPVVDHALRAAVRIEHEADAVAALGALVALEQAVEQRRQALQAWTDEHGAVAVNGVAAGYRPYDEVKFAAADVVRVLTAHEEPLDFLVSPSALSKFLKTKKRAAVGDDLRQYQQTASKTRWSTWKEVDE